MPATFCRIAWISYLKVIGESRSARYLRNPHMQNSEGVMTGDDVVGPWDLNTYGIKSSLFFFDKDENASQVAEIVYGIYGVDTVTSNYVQFWFRRFRSGIFDVKDTPRTGRPVVENVDKITEIIEVDRHASSRSIFKKLKNDHKRVLNHLRKDEFKKKLSIWVPHQLTQKHMMTEFPSVKPWPNGMKLTHFLSKRMVIGDK
ncbi:histone-lysine N-methyltransferase SETMAR [Trichonephila clavipes]|nr:histone-lysine N-methyltransferase SETMAR [Trichonephila clavipes]